MPPFDQGVIHSFKVHYRKSIVKHVIISEVIQIVQRLRLFFLAQSPQLHQAINDIEFKLIDIYLDSKISVQNTLHSYFRID